MVRGRHCHEACGIFPGQELNPWRLHWQADSLPLSHEGSPLNHIFNLKRFRMCRKVEKRRRNLPIMAVAEIITASTSKTTLMFQYNFMSILMTKYYSPIHPIGSEFWLFFKNWSIVGLQYWILMLDLKHLNPRASLIWGLCLALSAKYWRMLDLRSTWNIVGCCLCVWWPDNTLCFTCILITVLTDYLLSAYSVWCLWVPASEACSYCWGVIFLVNLRCANYSSSRAILLQAWLWWRATVWLIPSWRLLW